MNSPSLEAAESAVKCLATIAARHGVFESEARILKNHFSDSESQDQLGKSIVNAALSLDLKAKQVTID